MKLIPIITEYWKVDGGACFGVVPKSLWAKNWPPDENNMITIVNRNLLIDAGDRKYLLDTGFGSKPDEKYLANFQISNKRSITDALIAEGYHPDQVTDVLFSHLHVDHCGGALNKDENGKCFPVFRNAVHWTSLSQFENAIHPNARERASYFAENFAALNDAGTLQKIEQDQSISPEVELRITNGHSIGHLIALIKFNEKTLVCTGDFIPSSLHIPLPWVPAYDIQPLVSMDEKEKYLDEFAKKNYSLYFTHDVLTECCTLQHTDKGVRMQAATTLKQFQE
ncbi:MAG: MBL fold metallo-hydrolase [Bacteroidota bacterium]